MRPVPLAMAVPIALSSGLSGASCGGAAGDGGSRIAAGRTAGAGGIDGIGVASASWGAGAAGGVGAAATGGGATSAGFGGNWIREALAGWAAIAIVAVGNVGGSRAVGGGETVGGDWVGGDGVGAAELGAPAGGVAAAWVPAAMSGALCGAAPAVVSLSPVSDDCCSISICAPDGSLLRPAITWPDRWDDQVAPATMDATRRPWRPIEARADENLMSESAVAEGQAVSHAREGGGGRQDFDCRP